jgi:hypothetical protein
MSKFILNLLLQISKALVNTKIQFLIQKFFFLTFGPADLAAHSTFGPASPLAWPCCPRRLKPPRPAHLARASVESSREYVFPFGSRLLSWPPLPCLSAKWGRPVSFIFLLHRPTVAAFSLRLRPPRAARPPTSRCPARYSLHALIPLLNLPP